MVNKNHQQKIHRFIKSFISFFSINLLALIIWKWPTCSSSSASSAPIKSFYLYGLLCESIGVFLNKNEYSVDISLSNWLWFVTSDAVLFFDQIIHIDIVFQLKKRHKKPQKKIVIKRFFFSSSVEQKIFKNETFK